MTAEATHAMATSYGGCPPHLSLTDLRHGKAWIAYRFEGQELGALHGGRRRVSLAQECFR